MTKEEAKELIVQSVKDDVDIAKVADAIQTLEQPCEDMGEVSDGYHTFNQLYHQRAILFATIVNQNKDKAWKSFKHSDGHYCFDEDGEWFVVGVDTPEGSYTYHYHKKYWDYFDCKELECGKVWDGHTEEAVTRLLSLEQQPREDCISRAQALHACCDEWNKDYKAIMKSIRQLPSVTPQPKIGHWITTRTPMHLGEFYCDKCKCYSPNNIKWDWCPTCGAKMEVSK